jgi:hypothetical protein
MALSPPTLRAQSAEGGNPPSASAMPSPALAAAMVQYRRALTEYLQVAGELRGRGRGVLELDRRKAPFAGGETRAR